MAQEDLAPAFGLTEHLYSALSLAERASYLRQAGEGWIGSKGDTSRAAATLDRWKSQKPFPAGDSFEKRLRLDGLAEKDLLAILGLPPEVYSELITSPPDWVRELERLYFTPRPLDDDPEFLRYADERTNGFLWIAYPLFQEGLRRFREGAGRLPAGGVPFDPVTAERLVLPYLLETLKGALDLVMVLELNVARLQGVLKGETPEERFDSFCDRLRQMDVQLSIAREYPVLFRSLHIITMNWVDYNAEVRVPSAGHADHRSAVAEAAMGYDKKYVFAPRGQFESHFRSIWLTAPCVAKQARRFAACDSPTNFAFIAFGWRRLLRR